jgi:ParB family transcriptional regulator, chromosome partitioning protein
MERIGTMARTQKKAKAVTVATVEVVEAAAPGAAVGSMRDTVGDVMTALLAPGAAAEIVSLMDAIEIAANGAELFIPLNKLKKSPRNARKTPHTAAHIRPDEVVRRESTTAGGDRSKDLPVR